MSRLSPSFLLTWVITAVVTMLVWFLIPGQGVDRIAFEFLSKSLADPEAKIQGTGSHAEPWKLQVTAQKSAEPARPTLIGLKDNLDGIFQSSPHSPIDMAVIFNNLQRLGVRRLTCSVLLAWEDPDAIALTALESAMEEFDSVVLAAPVTRGAIMETMPPSFRRASIPIDAISGDTSTLPVVNRVSIPDLIHGGKKSLTGFEVIDTEPSNTSLPLVARWDDRVIFSFAVLATAQQCGVKVDDLEVEMGSHLRFGKSGHEVTIDEFGRLDMTGQNEPLKEDLLAEDLIDAKTGDANLPPFIYTLLCDYRSHADIATRDFNRMAPIAINTLLSGDASSSMASFARLDSIWEMMLLLALATGLSFFALMNRRVMGIISLVAVMLIVVIQWLVLKSGLWLPGLAASAAVITALMLSILALGQRKRTTSMPRLDRLAFESSDDEDKPDAVDEGQDYALAPKDTSLDSKHESD